MPFFLFGQAREQRDPPIKILDSGFRRSFLIPCFRQF